MMIIKKLFNLCNSKLQYKRFIIKAKKLGYKFCAPKEFLATENKSKVIVVTHSFSNKLKTAQKMYKLEHALGIKTAFYFSKNLLYYSFIKQLINNGFEASLLYQNLASFIIKNGIYNQKELNSFNWQEKSLHMLKDDLKLIKAEGIEVFSVKAGENKRLNSFEVHNSSLLLENNELTNVVDVDIQSFGKYFDFCISSFNYSNFKKMGKKLNTEISKGTKKILISFDIDKWC